MTPTGPCSQRLRCFWAIAPAIACWVRSGGFDLEPVLVVIGDDVVTIARKIVASAQ